eukprot:Nk52_evm27s163 gene=Nk52_evmTU27s163
MKTKSGLKCTVPITPPGTLKSRKGEKKKSAAPMTPESNKLVKKKAEKRKCAAPMTRKGYKRPKLMKTEPESVVGDEDILSSDVEEIVMSEEEIYSDDEGSEGICGKNGGKYSGNS